MIEDELEEFDELSEEARKNFNTISRKVFTVIFTLSLLSLILTVIYMYPEGERTSEQIIADIIKAIGYETEKATYDFWSRVLNSFNSIFKELIK